MWKVVTSSVRPNIIDETSSKHTVYIRKDITEKQKETGEVYYEYLENNIPKDKYELYTLIIKQDDDITNLEVAVCDLYEQMKGE